ncbi:MAG: hypothetical protein KKB70_08595 [Proteobacteria bacterium]|nr:hypothetical protein [Pseudomonadota bacterium]MBU1611185.1 hypothetical protein [Pseudomonadota bacterium]
MQLTSQTLAPQAPPFAAPVSGSRTLAAPENGPYYVVTGYFGKKGGDDLDVVARGRSFLDALAQRDAAFHRDHLVPCGVAICVEGPDGTLKAEW